MTGTLGVMARLGSRRLRVSVWRFTKRSSPVLLDAVGFALVTVGVWLLAGEWAWLAAGGLLILAGYRAQS